MDGTAAAQGAQKNLVVKREVQIVEDLDTAEILKDPIRRQILDLLGENEMTEGELAKKLEFSPAAIGHHLRELSRRGLIRVARTELESHGILQKFYVASARLIVVDYAKMPYSIRRYTLSLYIERVRGALALARIQNPELSMDRRRVEALSDALAREVVEVGRRPMEIPPGLTREDMILWIYSTALSRMSGTPEASMLQGSMTTIAKKARRA